MSVKTTLNIHVDILKKIDQASEVIEKSKSEIIILLLNEVMRHDTNKAALCSSVKYQDSAESKMWKKFHIKYNYCEYEYFLDLRKFLKMSLSRILAYAVKKYLDKLLSGEKSDNYHYKNYILGIGMVDDVIYWKLYWGYPKKTEKTIQQT